MDFAQDKQERANNFGKARRRFRVEWPNNGTNRRHRRAAYFQASSAKLLAAMRPYLTTKCPFANLPSSRTSHFGEGITTEEMKELCWLKPTLVAQISFNGWTNYGLLRHATFEGLRDDEEPRTVVRAVAAR